MRELHLLTLSPEDVVLKSVICLLSVTNQFCKTWCSDICLGEEHVLQV